MDKKKQKENDKSLNIDFNKGTANNNLFENDETKASLKPSQV